MTGGDSKSRLGNRHGLYRPASDLAPIKHQFIRLLHIEYQHTSIGAIRQKEVFTKHCYRLGGSRGVKSRYKNRMRRITDIDYLDPVIAVGQIQIFASNGD